MRGNNQHLTSNTFLFCHFRQSSVSVLNLLLLCCKKPQTVWSRWLPINLPASLINTYNTLSICCSQKQHRHYLILFIWSGTTHFYACSVIYIYSFLCVKLFNYYIGMYWLLSVWKLLSQIYSDYVCAPRFFADR